MFDSQTEEIFAHEIYHHSVAHKPQFDVATYQNFGVEPLTGALGAAIGGINIVERLTDPLVITELKKALADHLSIGLF